MQMLKSISWVSRQCLWTLAAARGGWGVPTGMSLPCRTQAVPLTAPQSTDLWACLVCWALCRHQKLKDKNAVSPLRDSHHGTDTGRGPVASTVTYDLTEV